MTRYRVLPYRAGSKSARALADALGGKVLKLEGSKYRPKGDDVVINWGSTEAGPLGGYRLFNPNVAIRNASNKLLFFNHMKAQGLEDIIPPFWTDVKDIPDEPGTYPVVCRTNLAGHSAAGLSMAATRADLVPCRLITKYIPKQQEYRVHQGQGGLIFLQRKARCLDVPDDRVNWQVRNLANGFIFVQAEIGDTPPCVLDVAKRGLNASGLDFGGCDVIYNQKQDRAYLLEINTAVGLEPRTAEAYANYFRNLI